MPRFTPVYPGFPIAPRRHRAQPPSARPGSGRETDALFSRPGGTAD